MNNKNKLGVLVCVVGLTSVLLAHAQSAFKADGLVESTAGGFKFPDGTVQNTSAVPGGTYAVGGTGPGGGIVFWMTLDGLHGLEAAQADASPVEGVAWGCYDTQVGAFARGLGSGVRNTDAILRGCIESPIAAALADQFIGGDFYFDWYLPSRDELALMHSVLHLNGLGNFCADAGVFCIYWSSSEFSNFDAGGRNFLDGDGYVGLKNNTNRVRAIRAF